jgi:hypothetical protein
MLDEDVGPVPQGKVIYKFSDGWTVQELVTPEQIFAEGEANQNCLRESSFGPQYLEQVENGESRIFSLRNPNGRPSVSMEFVVDKDESGAPTDSQSGHFEQIFAKQNTSLGASLKTVKAQGGTEELWKAIQKYKPKVREFIIKKFGGDPGALVMMNEPLEESVVEVAGDLVLRDYKHPLPAGFESVGSDLYLEGYDYPLPAGLKSVGGHLYLRGYKHPLPDGFKSVGGDLYLRGYNHHLPAGFKRVGGNLDLEGYKHPLPAGFKSVGRDLFLGGYKHPLPSGLDVYGDIVR